MARYQPERRKIFPGELRCALRAILMIDSVESKAAYALRQPFIRTGVNKRCIGQGAVESGIKDSDLRDGSEFLFDESTLLMDRCVGRHKGAVTAGIRKAEHKPGFVSVGQI